MVEALLRQRLAARGIDADVSSAGDLPGGVGASAGAIDAMAARGLDLTEHRSRQLMAEHVASADLVIAMARRHLRSAVTMVPAAFPRTFTLPELARRGADVGRRRADEPLGEWLARVHAGRTAAGLLGDDPLDDVADPMGGTPAQYEATAAELEALIDRVIDLALDPASNREHA
jgi:protein-tyrosine phosphatase